MALAAYLQLQLVSSVLHKTPASRQSGLERSGWGDPGSAQAGGAQNSQLRPRAELLRQRCLTPARLAVLREAVTQALLCFQGATRFQEPPKF